MNLTLITSALAAALGFGAAWTWQGRAIDKIKLEHSDAVIVQQRNARAAIERATGAVIAAQNEARVRDGVIRRDAAAAASSGNGLRLASTSAVRTASADSDACGAVVAAYDQLLAEGSEFIREVAEVADQCISDNQALTDGSTRGPRR